MPPACFAANKDHERATRADGSDDVAKRQTWSAPLLVRERSRISLSHVGTRKRKSIGRHGVDVGLSGRRVSRTKALGFSPSSRFSRSSRLSAGFRKRPCRAHVPTAGGPLVQRARTRAPSRIRSLGCKMTRSPAARPLKISVSRPLL